MTHERGARPESKNCKILLFPTADRRFDTKVKCPTGRASFWVKFPTIGSLTQVKCPGIAQGGWAVLELTGTLVMPNLSLRKSTTICLVSSLLPVVSNLQFHRNSDFLGEGTLPH